jgi:hypothetical protein
MKIWEQEIFEKEYADLNWFKGKQPKHVKAMEVARKKAGLGPSHSPGPASQLTARVQCSQKSSA